MSDDSVGDKRDGVCNTIRVGLYSYLVFVNILLIILDIKNYSLVLQDVLFNICLFN